MSAKQKKHRANMEFAKTILQTSDKMKPLATSKKEASESMLKALLTMPEKTLVYEDCVFSIVTKKQTLPLTVKNLKKWMTDFHVIDDQEDQDPSEKVDSLMAFIKQSRKSTEEKQKLSVKTIA